jgi:hypothetical protein
MLAITPTTDTSLQGGTAVEITGLNFGPPSLPTNICISTFIISALLLRIFLDEVKRLLLVASRVPILSGLVTRKSNASHHLVLGPQMLYWYL